jgi:hypothetical protein
VTKQGLRDQLCSRFCTYYKPGKNEAFACRGYVVTERLVRRRRGMTFERAGAGCDPAGIELLTARLCTSCDFRDDGCDFIIDRTSLPCGGFQFLSQALAQGEITAEDLD